ncbi:hypothetical protein P3X46_022846 [Hevea brasiliensis]|uniref:ATPase family AAA domain-containing protein n=1 Tax=Hevea brasiliensis TaxID=3981 RepID=A0ABQ9LA76_HEVBR|nr:uncharacterized protein LOC110651698 [Hevea brasiliensis]KAJ9163147.1 hypothetical protein P3X46_022846 [Hevea brasiliensis]
MATNLVPLGYVAIRASAAPVPHRSDPNGRKSFSSPSANWWSPLFGWSSEPDYIGSESKPGDLQEKKEVKSESDLEPKSARSRFAPGGFTEEKAKQLRMLTSDTSSFHDAMYHSAIASRLASDFRRRSDR